MNREAVPELDLEIVVARQGAQALTYHTSMDESDCQWLLLYSTDIFHQRSTQERGYI